MKKYVLFLFSIFLIGCGAEEIDGNFELTAAQGFVGQNNYETPHTYVIDRNQEKVYIDTHLEGFTDEEREAFESMSSEEFNDFINNQPVPEEPLYAITLLEATKEEIVLEYEGERVVFTALSDSYYKTEDGTQYVIEVSNGIDAYLNQK